MINDAPEITSIVHCFDDLTNEAQEHTFKILQKIINDNRYKILLSRINEAERNLRISEVKCGFLQELFEDLEND